MNHCACIILCLSTSCNTVLTMYYVGSEVAQYTAEKFPDFLKTVSAYGEGDMATALKEAFLGFDETLTKDDVKQQLAVLASGDKDGGEADEEEEEEGLCH